MLGVVATLGIRCLSFRVDGFEVPWTWYCVLLNGRVKVVEEVASQVVVMRSRSNSARVEGSSRIRFREGEEKCDWNIEAENSGCMSVIFSLI